MTLLAFHEKQAVKDFYLTRLEDHYKSDEIIKGTYWEKGKGCAVGCTIHSSDHSLYESELGIPIWLAKLEDRIFEGLPNDKAKEWPLKFIKCIEPGINLENIKIPFLIYIVESVIDKFDHKKYPKIKSKIDNILFSISACDSPAVSAGAAVDAENAAAAAATAYSYAAGVYSYAAAAYAEAAATYAVVTGTYDGAAAAAVAAAVKVADADANAVAAEDAESATYEKFSNKLIKLIKENQL